MALRRTAILNDGSSADLSITFVGGMDSRNVTSNELDVGRLSKVSPSNVFGSMSESIANKLADDELISPLWNGHELVKL